MVGVAEEAGVHLRHSCEQALLVVVQRVPPTDDIALEDDVGIPRVDLRELRALGDDAELDLTLQRVDAVLLVPGVEVAPVLFDPLLRRVMRRVCRAGSEVHEEGPVWVRLLSVGDESDRGVGAILREVVPILRRRRLLDVVVVGNEVGVPLVRLAAEEPVVAVETATERPGLREAAWCDSVSGVRCHFPTQSENAASPTSSQMM